MTKPSSPSAKATPRRRWVRSTDHVWCDAHCTIHGRERDYYGEGDENCHPVNWRPVAVQTDNPAEEF